MQLLLMFSYPKEGNETYVSSLAPQVEILYILERLHPNNLAVFTTKTLSREIASIQVVGDMRCGLRTIRRLRRIMRLSSNLSVLTRSYPRTSRTGMRHAELMCLGMPTMDLPYHLRHAHYRQMTRVGLLGLKDRLRQP